MNSRFFRILSYLAVILLILLACNSSEQKTEATETDTSATTTEVSSPAPAPVNTIVTTPQSMMVVKHKIKNFADWKMGYDSHDSARLANGLHSYVISRGLSDSNMVMVTLKADDMAKAKAFAKDPYLKKAMAKSGVIGNPTIQFVTITFMDTVQVSTNLRSQTIFKVKDWAVWEKGFKEGEQERIENGITVRAYGHDADDNNKVRLVTALIDTAKARAYWMSDKLKKRRLDNGVIGEPERFVYQVVKRY